MDTQKPWATSYLFLLAPIFIVLLNYSGYSTGILVGDDVEWTQNGWLVKVLARNKNGTAQTCSGSLISTTLVLTAAECVLNRVTRRPWAEFMVITKKPNAYHYFNGSLLESKDKAWALIKIPKQNLSEVCPPTPAFKKISRLNIRPSLIKSSMFEIVLSSPCQLVGFETVPNANEFMQYHRTLRLKLSKLQSPKRPSTFHWSMVTENDTACFEDAGLSLVCATLDNGPLQVGIFQALRFPDGEKPHLNGTDIEICPLATGMEFSMLHTDVSLVRALQKHNMNDIVRTYEACGFI